MKKKNKGLILLVFVLCSVKVYGQQTKKVLFLGNSYTGVNNLPLLTANMASSTGKTLVYDTYAPGGYYLAYHLTDTISLAKIAVGNWDNVVLQDQSMALAYPSTYMNFLKYTAQLDSIIKAQNRCCQTIFYSTWGRKNGDTYLCTPPDCAVDTWITRTYYEMDSAITTHYKVFADSLKASMTPVGAVWRYIRRHYPSIELFHSDESHASLAGTYAAACCFYTTIFRSDPALITFNSGLSAADAANIRTAVKQTVYDHLADWNIGPFDNLLDPSCWLLSIDEERIKKEYWQVFPNPVNDVLNIRFLEKPAQEKIDIYNTQGATIETIQALPLTKIDLSAQPTGLYIIKSRHNGSSFKIVKQ